MTGIGHDSRMTGGTTGRVDTDGIFHVTAHQTERVVVTQVLLRGKRNLTDILYGLNTVGSNPQVT